MFLIFFILKQKNSCECLKEEAIEKCYFNIHDRINKMGDFIRKIVLLQDLYSLSKIIIVWFFMIKIGESFSTIATILISNFLF